MGAIQDLQAWLKASRVKPQLQPNTTQMPARGSQDGAIYTQSLVPTKHVLADEGSYFVTTNPTPQTVLAYGAAGTQAAFSDTVPFMQLINTGNPGDPAAPLVWFDYLKLIQIGGTAPATTTSVGFAIKVDNGFRAATAGTPVTATPVSPNMNLATAQPAARLVYFTGAVATIPAASAAARLVARGTLKGGPTLVLDEYTISAGAVDGTPMGGYLTAVAAYNTRVPPIGIGPGQSMTIHLFFPGGATNPFSYEFELGHWER
jgi:hypothetical protein